MSTQDYFRKRIQRALVFIERHLTDSISATDIARAACFSPYHFHRVFAAYTGETVQKYVQSRRMELAAKRLSGGSKVGMAELALSVGFETHSAFSRAFRRHFGVTPSEFGRGVHCPAPDRTRPYLLTVPIERVDWSFEERTTGPLTLIHRITSTTIEGHFFDMPTSQGDLQRLWDKHSDSLLGVVSGYPASPTCLNDDLVEAWYGGLVQAGHSLDWSDRTHALSAGHWAVFRHEGDYRYLHQTWGMIYRSWLPQSDRLLRDEIPFELYLSDPRESDPVNWVTEIWIPLE